MAAPAEREIRVEEPVQADQTRRTRRDDPLKVRPPPADTTRVKPLLTTAAAVGVLCWLAAGAAVLRDELADVVPDLDDALR